MSMVDPQHQTFAGLPANICAVVVAHLANRDIKCLRLVCRALRDNYPLRLDRVFLSANPLNIRVFLSIANHETFRHGIVEIIWDDAQLIGTASREEEDYFDELEGYPSDDSDEEIGGEVTPKWYSLLCRKNLSEERSRKGLIERATQRARMQQGEEQMPLGESWAYYRGLLRQQEQVLLDGSDIAALRYGLRRFPALRRIEVTPAAHGFVFGPLYETPMIHSFPYGFNYPIPRGWPTPEIGSLPYKLRPLVEEDERRQWRGVGIVLRELTQNQEHHVIELLFDVHNLNTGVSSRIFEQPCEELQNLETLLRRPNFRYLDLSLLSDGDENGDWRSLHNERLHNALSQATSLEHIHFRAQIDFDQFDMPDPDFPPIRAMLPVHQWPRLRHFGLVNVLVDHDELLSVLASLSNNIRSVELTLLRFVDETETQGYNGLLRRLRDDLDWRSRPQNERPRIIIRGDSNGGTHGRYLCLDKEVHDFVYGEGDNPFLGLWPHPTVGVLRGAFEPDLESVNLLD